jgi:hypothetical protein
MSLKYLWRIAKLTLSMSSSASDQFSLDCPSISPTAGSTVFVLVDSTPALMPVVARVEGVAAWVPVRESAEAVPAVAFPFPFSFGYSRKLVLVKTICEYNLRRLPSSTTPKAYLLLRKCMYCLSMSAVACSSVSLLLLHHDRVCAQLAQS